MVIPEIEGGGGILRIFGVKARRRRAPSTLHKLYFSWGSTAGIVCHAASKLCAAKSKLWQNGLVGTGRFGGAYVLPKGLPDSPRCHFNYCRTGASFSFGPGADRAAPGARR